MATIVQNAMSGLARLGLLWGSGAIPRSTPMKAQGSSGVAIFGGYVQSLEKSPEWGGLQKYVTSADIAVNVSIVAASVHYFLNLIAHPQWNVEPAEDGNAEAERYAELVEEMLYDMLTPWPRIVRRAGMYRFHGFGLQEWIAKKRDDGVIGLKDIEPRPQHTVERWEVDEAGKVLGVWQRSPQTGQYIGLPRSKLVYLVEDTLSDSPEGIGIFRHLGEPYNRLRQYLKLELRAYERDLRGTPMGRAPLGLLRKAVADGKMPKEDAEALIQGMRDFVSTEVKGENTGFMLDSQPYESLTASGFSVAGVQQWGMELLQGGGAGLSEIAQAIERLQREMARILGTESLMMGGESTGGSRSLSEDKSTNLYLVANAVLGTIADGMRRDLLDPIWTLNGWPEELKPYLKTEDVATRDVNTVTKAIVDMAQAGAVLDPTDPVINDVRDLLGVSHAPDPTPQVLGEMGRDDEGEPYSQDEIDQFALDEQEAQMEVASRYANENVPGKPKPKPGKVPVKKGEITYHYRKRRRAIGAGLDRFLETGDGLFSDKE